MAKLLAKIPTLATAALEAAKPRLSTFMHYAKVELVPPTPAELGGVAAGLGNIVKSAQSGAWKNLTVKRPPSTPWLPLRCCAGSTLASASARVPLLAIRFRLNHILDARDSYVCYIWNVI